MAEMVYCKVSARLCLKPSRNYLRSTGLESKCTFFHDCEGIVSVSPVSCLKYSIFLSDRKLLLVMDGMISQEEAFVRQRYVRLALIFLVNSLRCFDHQDEGQ